MKPGDYRRHQLKWIGNRVTYGGNTLSEIIPDAQWPQMWRVKYPDGRVSDMVNLSRACEAAMDAALVVLNSRVPRGASSGPPIRQTDKAATPPAPAS